MLDVEHYNLSESENNGVVMTEEMCALFDAISRVERNTKMMGQ